ncbi:MAG: metalloregulator ArsR/SmtB family transcription factor [Thermoanaerobaculia bacterium]
MRLRLSAAAEQAADSGVHKDKGSGLTTFGYNDFIMLSPSTSKALDVTHMSRLFKALGDETRLRIVALLSHDELCVCHLEEVLSLSQPNISRQLSVLKNAGVVERRREGTWVYYRLAEQSTPDRERHLSLLVESFKKRGVLKRDLTHLMKIRGPEACKWP